MYPSDRSCEGVGTFGMIVVRPFARFEALWFPSANSPEGFAATKSSTSGDLPDSEKKLSY